MTILSRSLFIRIFLWFWLTVIVTAIALLVTLILQHNSVPERWHGMLISTAQYSGNVTIAEMQRGGVSAVATYFGELEREGHLQACLFDATGNVIAGQRCDSFQMLVHRLMNRAQPIVSMRFGIARAAMKLTGANGQTYIFATELPVGPRAAFGAGRFSFLLEWAVALFVSGCVCYALTRHITGPILRLRAASQRLAAGDLTSRAEIENATRSDELGALVRDFNRMAGRIEQLIAGERQLICDISHELRSPLARLNVALDLVRHNKSSELALDRMGQDLQRLDEMIGRVLTLARLDAPAGPLQFAPIPLTALVAEIVHDASFESSERSIRVALTVERDYQVEGNAELLHSAIENVIRNAVRYTGTGTQVNVILGSSPPSDQQRIQVIIRDEGPGVPEEELAHIFRPFYRVAEARDRQSGGVGLGLAITERVVRLHGGTIQASNVLPHGLQVVILLPERHA